ncbi:MAG: peptide ABC transporter substrate-binding protein, partial [Schwartzia sp. (in: firmicutes)]
YTQKLLSAAFRDAAEKSCPAAALPAPDLTPGGCEFKNECPYRLDRCRTEKPLLSAVAPEHTLACFLAAD